MISIPFQIDAEERLVFSRTSASTGIHETLDYVPGSALLGALAREFYPLWKSSRRSDAFRMFHSGLVSFGDAHPLDASGRPSIRTPFSFHRPKPQPGQPAENDRDILNRAAAPHPEGVQLVQSRDEWLGTSGHPVSVLTGHILKTARDTANFGTPARSQLFGYSYIEAGQSFAGTIRVDDSCRDLAEILQSRMASGQPVHLGRSNHAEFGRCRLSPGSDGIDAWEPPGKTESLPEFLRLLALSDLWFPDGLSAEGSALHESLAGYRIDPSRTFLRFRRYSPWNAFRGFPDAERQIVSRGSVITLARTGATAPDAAPDLARLRAVLENGLGSGLAEGLGRVLVHPPLLASEHPDFPENTEPEASGARRSTASRPDSDPFLPRIERRWANRWIEMEADRLADFFVAQWRRFAKPRPRRSQWSQLRHIARSAASPEEFAKSFEAFSSSGAASWKWKGTAPGEKAETTLATAIRDAWEHLPHPDSSKSDPRASAKANREKAFLAAVAEAARRLRDH